MTTEHAKSMNVFDSLHVKSGWRHQMETFPALLAICTGIHRSLVNSTHKGQLRGALMFSLICAWINGWENNGEAGDLRRRRAHYDGTVMFVGFNMMFILTGVILMFQVLVFI